jgi:sulfite exporter TauE/SafE
MTFVGALRGGISEGLRLFKWTVLYLLLFALPALPFLMAIQLGTAFMAERMRPEMIAVVVAIYSILISFATYLTYAAAARLHWASQVEEA